MPGHGRNHVVEDDQHETVVVVDGVGDPGQTGVEQRAVADEADDALFRPHRQFQTGGHGGRRAHAHADVGHAQGRHESEGVTPDVRGEDDVPAFAAEFHAIVGHAVRAARAQGRRAVDQLRGIREIQRRGGHVGDAEGFGYGGAHTGGGIFVQRGKVGGPLAEDGQG